MDENKAPALIKADPVNGSANWLKRSQSIPGDVNSLRIRGEKKRPQRVESLDKVISSPEFSENARRNEFSKFLHVAETPSSGSDSGKSRPKAYPDENGSSEQSSTFTKLKLLQSREETFKEIFMGVCFSFDLTNGRVTLEMNITPSTEKRSGFLIRF